MTSVKPTKDDESDIDPLAAPPPRTSSAGHSLRQRKDLHLSSKARENADKPLPKKGRYSNPQLMNPTPQVASGEQERTKTARNEVRDAIASETAVKRSKFFIEKKDFFLPLLPENNAVQKLIAEKEKIVGTGESGIIEYEEILEQPEG